jgi:hypothetical protein
MVLRNLLTTFRMFSSRQGTSDDEEEFKLPSMASLVIMLVMNFLLQVRHLLHETLQRSLTVCPGLHRYHFSSSFHQQTSMRSTWGEMLLSLELSLAFQLVSLYFL